MEMQIISIEPALGKEDGQEYLNIQFGTTLTREEFLALKTDKWGFEVELKKSAKK